ncbi:MAG: hypothetical protein WBD99_12080 [Thermodesulfobacteriota bacterium]
MCKQLSTLGLTRLTAFIEGATGSVVASSLLNKIGYLLGALRVMGEICMSKKVEVPKSRED